MGIAIDSHRQAGHLPISRWMVFRLPKRWWICVAWPKKGKQNLGFTEKIQCQMQDLMEKYAKLHHQYIYI